MVVWPGKGEQQLPHGEQSTLQTVRTRGLIESVPKQIANLLPAAGTELIEGIYMGSQSGGTQVFHREVLFSVESRDELSKVLGGFNHRNRCHKADAFYHRIQENEIVQLFEAGSGRLHVYSGCEAD